MMKYSANNERIKRSYFTYLKEAKRQSEQSVDAVAKSLARFESYTHFKDFKTFHYQQAVAFKNHLAKQKALRSGDVLSKATLHSTLTALQRFFQWLAGQPGYKSRMKYSDADYFNLSDNDVRVATAHREQKAPTMAQVRRVLTTMPCETDIERRNRALLAFTLLTGARDSAIASIKLKHVDLMQRCVQQDAREVKTKFSKTFTTFFFPVGDDVFGIVESWVRYLQEEKLWGNDDPLFPATRIALGETRQFEAAGLDRKHWSNATAIRKIFCAAFESAGLPYFNPHSFRHTLVRLGETACKSPEEFKAWSQNLGHAGVLTTFCSYGEVGNFRQGEIIRGLAKPQQAMQPDINELAKAIAREMLGSVMKVTT